MRVNKRKLAELLDVSEVTLTAWQRDGLPVHTRRGKVGEANAYDLKACIAWVRSRDVEQAAEGGAKARRERIDTARAELGLYREAGKVVAVDTMRQVLDRWVEAALGVMDGLEEKYAVRMPQVAGDDLALRETLRALVREIRESLADLDLAGAFAGAGSGDPQLELDVGEPDAGEVPPAT